MTALVVEVRTSRPDSRTINAVQDPSLLEWICEQSEGILCVTLKVTKKKSQVMPGQMK